MIVITFIQRAIMQSIPLLFGSTGETITEKGGNLNLGIPGIMYVGGICGVIGAFFYEQAVPADQMSGFLAILIPMLCSLLGSLLMGLLYCFLTVTLRANQNVTGLTMTTFGVGIGNFFGGSLIKLTGSEVPSIALSATSGYFAKSLPFAKSLGFGSLDALKADLRAKKQKIHEEGADRAAGKQLLDMAGANMTVTLPAEILDRTARNEMKLLTERLSRSGITLEQHCKNSHTTPEALEKDYRAQAESRIRFVLAARAIAEAEGIVVHPEEVNAEYRRLSQLQDTPEAEIRKALPEDTIAAALAAKKVQRFLLDNAQVTTVTDAPEKE